MPLAAGFMWLAVAAIQAAPRPASPFSDHMVLQRDMPVPVWGEAAPGERVEVKFAGQTAKARADASGRWQALLDPLEASADGRDMVVEGAGTVTFKDVVVGEVWLCSGQSNMAFPVQGKAGSVLNAAEERKTADFPLIRQLRVPKANKARPVRAFDARWIACAPDTVGEFPGVGYFFARELYRRLNVPVGIITSAYGGTPIEAWMSRETFNADAACRASRERFNATAARWPEIVMEYRTAAEAWQKEADAAKAAGGRLDKPRPRQPVGPDHPYSPSTVYNAMLHPLVPFAVRGVLWYQGESNVEHADEYAGMFAALIRQWRAEWQREDLPFHFVQLANFKGGGPAEDWAALRQAQAKALELPRTGMAVAIDIGNPDDLHPKNKQEVGRRLALVALASTYGQQDVKSRGPVFRAMKTDGDALRLSFDHAAGLVLRGDGGGFEIAGADQEFHPAQASIQDGELVLSAAGVVRPVSVRYAWDNAPVASLFNGDGLPAEPFRAGGPGER